MLLSLVICVMGVWTNRRWRREVKKEEATVWEDAGRLLFNIIEFNYVNNGNII